MVAAGESDFFQRARRFAGALLLIAAALAIVGSLLDWIVLGAPEVPPGAEPVPETHPALREVDPLSGVELGDGRWTLGAGVVLALCALLLIVRPASRYAWLALVAAIVIGGVSFSAYRSLGVGEFVVPLPGEDRDLFVFREGRAALGLILVTASAFVGLLGSVAAIVASPARAD